MQNSKTCLCFDLIISEVDTLTIRTHILSPSYIITANNCKNAECRFAHSFKELRELPCPAGERCMHANCRYSHLNDPATTVTANMYSLVMYKWKRRRDGERDRSHPRYDDRPRYDERDRKRECRRPSPRRYRSPEPRGNRDPSTYEFMPPPQYSDMDKPSHSSTTYR